MRVYQIDKNEFPEPIKPIVAKVEVETSKGMMYTWMQLYYTGTQYRIPFQNTIAISGKVIKWVYLEEMVPDVMR